MPDGEILRDVQQFVAQHPEGELWVCTGYTSAWGLARLAEMAPDRSVLVLVGRVRDSVTESATEADRRDAEAFLQRPDVGVQSWFRTGRTDGTKRQMHIKAFITDPKGPARAALVGSANLTQAGLLHNQEAMVTANPHDATKLVNQVQDLIAGYEDQTEAVLKQLSPSTGGRRGQGKQAADAADRDSDRAQEKKGCLSSVAASVALAVAVVVTAVLLLF